MRGLAVSEVVDDETQRGKTLVDCLRLLQGVSSGASLCYLLAACKIDEVQLTSLARKINTIVLMDRNDEARVASRRLSVHISVPNGSVFVTELHDLVDFELLANVCLCDVGDINTLLFVFVDFQIGLDWIEEISDLLHVYFNHAHFD